MVESKSDTNSAQIKSNKECLKENQLSKDNQNSNNNSNDVNQTDVEMRNANSIDNISTAGLSSEPSSEPCVASTSSAAAEDESKEITVCFKLVFKKNNYDITIGLNKTVSQLKEQIQRITSVAPAMQKLLFKGQSLKHLFIFKIFLLIQTII